ncbi:hypothetical protein PROFUN_14107 [Planoprotostelium fungivorum]|uniref:Uncharacterized protein n=1 Tax=Planoprotostelium fungivorum TaxID=1890364 RepID=A0A2P6N204_9EUKA|nr:hypothetical protein PROFUN_14107 [Planoprotostelium fungivorum]
MVSTLGSYDDCVSDYKHTVIIVTIILIVSTLLICGVCAFVAHTFNKSQAEVYRTTHDTFKDASYSTFTAPPVQNVQQEEEDLLDVLDLNLDLI